MKIEEILTTYPIDILEQLAANKVLDIGHIRLPKDVLIEELTGIINKLSYVDKAISFRNPPSFQIMDLILNALDFKIPVKGFKDKVIESTENFINKAKQTDWVKSKKNYSLYLKMLQTAWESDSKIDSSETILLNTLRDGLNISFKEHIVLEHHEELVKFWNTDNYYEKERNYLISIGIVYPIDEYYVIPESIGKFIRKTWGMDLNNEQYARILSYLANNDLSDILAENELHVSGASTQKVQRIIENFISPRKALLPLSVESLRNLARNSGSIVSGTKEDVIENLIDFFDDDEDLKLKETDKEIEVFIPEQKILNHDNFTKLFNLLSNEQLYNIADCLKKIKRSGNKDSRIANLWGSSYNEKTMLNQLSNTELYILCEKNGLKLSGPKTEKINRLIEAASNLETITPNTIDENESNPIDLIKTSANDQIFNSQDNIPVKNIQLLSSEEFPFLETDELTVLSWIKDLKSVNEYELDRLIARHNLSWFFPRTQIENLKGKLVTNNKDVLSIRHVGDYCIYEYIS